MKRLTKEQLETRDAELDWVIARHAFHAEGRNVWNDYSPTTDWKEAGLLIERYKIDIRYFSKERNPNLEGEWMGGLQMPNKHGIQTFFTAFADTPLKAAMKALAKGLNK